MKQKEERSDYGNMGAQYREATRFSPYKGPDSEKIRQWTEGKGSIRTESIITTQRGKVGLQNIGNTCYMNSALQCLLHTPQLIILLLQGKLKISSMNISYANEFIKILAAFVDNTSPSATLRPYNLKHLMEIEFSQFLGMEQQDSIDFLQHLLEVLSIELNRVIVKAPCKSITQTNAPIPKQVSID
jgi:ubiquitin C-terminal hydrolase